MGRLIAASGNLKHQTALSLAYGTGLRASEIVSLKIGDIDKVLLGHKKLDATALYAQVATDLLREVVSLLEMLHPT